MKEKKPFLQTTVGKIVKQIGIIAIGIVLKKQKFNKTDKDEKKIDDILNNIP